MVTISETTNSCGVKWGPNQKVVGSIANMVKQKQIRVVMHGLEQEIKGWQRSFGKAIGKGEL